VVEIVSQDPMATALLAPLLLTLNVNNPPEMAALMLLHDGQEFKNIYVRI
jgi:hypothetical protein